MHGVEQEADFAHGYELVDRKSSYSIYALPLFSLSGGPATCSYFNLIKIK
jgi:hypothetical protein